MEIVSYKSQLSGNISDSTYVLSASQTRAFRSRRAYDGIPTPDRHRGRITGAERGDSALDSMEAYL